MSLSPLHLKCITTRMRASLHWVFSILMCFLKMVRIPPQPKELRWLLHWQKCVTNPLFVAHACMLFTTCYKCLSMVSRERSLKQITRSSTKSALKMSIAIREGSWLISSPKHLTDWTSPVGTPSSTYNSSESVVPILTRIRWCCESHQAQGRGVLCS